MFVFFIACNSKVLSYSPPLLLVLLKYPITSPTKHKLYKIEVIYQTLYNPNS